MPKFLLSKAAYKPIPKIQIDIDEYVTDAQWYHKFISLCGSKEQAFEGHVGQASSYNLKPQLMSSLKFLYAILSGSLDEVNPSFILENDRKSALITKINEGIGQCTPGFHARIDSLLDGNSQKTIEELLSQIRKNIVERTANQHTDEVHANNRFFIIAESMGMGIEPKLRGDPYRGAIDDTQIRQYLLEAFNKDYQPFTVLLGLKDMLAVSFDGYTGKSTDPSGYTQGMYAPGLDCLQSIFNETVPDYDYLITNDHGIIIDINWNLILNKLWGKLNERGFFKAPPQSFLSSVFSWITWSKPPTPKIVALVHDLFANPTMDNIKANQLSDLSTSFSSLTECTAYLSCNPDLPVNHTTDLLLQTLKRMYDENLDFDDYEFWTFVYDNRDNRALLSGIIEAYEFKANLDIHQLLINTQISEQRLKILHFKLLNLYYDEIEQLLITKNSSQETGLFHAISVCIKLPKVMSLFINLLNYTTTESNLLKLLTSTDRTGKNILSLALSKGSKGHNEAAAELLNHNKNLPIADQHVLFQLNEKPHQNSPLILAIKHYPSVALKILKVMISLDNLSQTNMTNFCLENYPTTSRQNLCFWRLLELGQRVNLLAEQPHNVEAYLIAKHLQSTLINCLDDYMENAQDPEAYPKLKTQWLNAIETAKVSLGTLPDWETFFQNLILVLISIPLLGLPLLINYYNSNCESVFFKSSNISALNHFENVIAHDNLA